MLVRYVCVFEEQILIGWLQPSGVSSDELIAASLLIGEITELL